MSTFAEYAEALEEPISIGEPDDGEFAEEDDEGDDEDEFDEDDA